MNRLRWMLWLLLLLSGVSFAQGTVSRGGALKKRAYQTYSAVTLFVDPTGSDANACTAVGTAACLTINGALAKLPRFINHNVVVNVAAGTYAPFTVSEFIIAGGVSLTITGAAMADLPSVPSGSVTGTLTGYTVGTFPARTALTDTSQAWPATWSPDDIMSMRGRFVTITGGAGVGQSRLIAQSSPTTLELLANFSPAPTAGSTYAIQEPSTVVSSGTLTLMTVSNVRGQLTINLLKFLRTVGTVPLVSVPTARAQSGLRLSMTSCLVDSAATSSQTVAFNAPETFTFTDTSVLGGNNGTTLLVTGNTSRLTLNRCYLSGQRGALSTFNTAYTSLSSVMLDSRNITVNYVWTPSAGVNATNIVWIVCNARAENWGYFGGLTGINSIAGSSSLRLTNVSIDGCGNGISTDGTNILGSGVVEMKNINKDNYLSVPPGAAYNVTGKAFIDLRAVTSLIYTSVSFDGGVTYLLGGEEVNDATLAALPDGGQVFENSHGVIYRR